LRKVEFEFAKALGIPVSEDRKVDYAGVITFMPSTDAPDVQGNTISNYRDNIIGQELKYNPNKCVRWLDGEIIFFDSSKQSKYMKRYRTIIYIHMLYDIPKDIDYKKNYYIEYTIFGQKQRYKVDMASAFSYQGDIMVPINKLRVFYFFSYDRKGVAEFINQQKTCPMALYCGEEKIGTTEIDLKDFLSDHVIKSECFKVFSGKTLPILSWGIKLTLGLLEGGDEDITKLKLNTHKGVLKENY